MSENKNTIEKEKEKEIEIINELPISKELQLNAIERIFKLLDPISKNEMFNYLKETHFPIIKN